MPGVFQETQLTSAGSPPLFYLMVGNESDQIEVKQAISEIKRFAVDDMREVPKTCPEWR